jgi:prepilin-type N-terminal cleavage/methylation domain-containing protein
MHDFTRTFEFVTRRHFPSPGARVAGFTTIEMLMVVAIFGILAATAAPSFAPMIASKRAETAATDLYVALVQSRSEATKRNASATLAHKTGGWGIGWQLTVIDPTDSTNTLTLDDHSVTNSVTVTGPDTVVYQSSGRVQGATNPSFAVTGTSGSSTEHRWVCIDLSGRPMVKISACP